MEHRKAGFTLVEVLTVLAIVAIVIALAAPALGRMHAHAQTEAALNQFSRDLSLARMLAIRSGSRVELAFAGGAACGAHRFGRFTADAYRITVLTPSRQLVREARLSEIGPGVCLDSNNDRTIVFDSRGLPVPFENRRVWSRRGPVADSLFISVLGRVRRR